MRLFIAIDIPKSMRLEILKLQRELMRLSKSGRFVPIENMHITLSFLGELNDTKAPIDAMKRAVKGVHSFDLRLGEYSFFERGESKTSILKVRGDLHELYSLHDALSKALRDNGLPGDDKRFSPHITLGRDVLHDETATRTMLESSRNIDSSMSVQNIILFESIRTAKGMVYTPLHKEAF